jgi:membrane protease YdiL (CAAX protease family)
MQSYDDPNIDLAELIIRNLKESHKTSSPVELFNFFLLNDLIPNNIRASLEIQHIRIICENLARDGILIKKEAGKYAYFENIKAQQEIAKVSTELEKKHSKKDLQGIISKIQKDIYLPILCIAAGEILMFFGHVYSGLAVHVINLQVITLFLVMSRISPEKKNVLQSLLLLLMLRMINLAMPQFFTLSLLSYPLVYGVMFIPVYYITRHQNITSLEIGIHFRRWYLYLPAALVIGAAIALLEFRIIQPTSLILNLKLQNILLIVVVMFVFVAAVEELIFRSILQTRLEKVIGSYQAVFISAFLFGIMHAGYGLISEVIFATFIGAVLGFIFLKTKSFPFILVIHGTVNALVFGILPIISG